MRSPFGSRVRHQSWAFGRASLASGSGGAGAAGRRAGGGRRAVVGISLAAFSPAVGPNTSSARPTKAVALPSLPHARISRTTTHSPHTLSSLSTMGVQVDSLLSTAGSMLKQATTFGTHPNLYPGLDRASLGLMDRAWVGWYEWFGNPILATFIGAVLLHEVSPPVPCCTRSGGGPVLCLARALTASRSRPLQIVYFGRSIPFIWMDSRPDLFLQYKIQPKQQISAAEQWHCTKVVLYNHFLVETPQMLAFQPLAAWVGMQTYQVPLPSWTTMVWQIALFFFVEDTWHYFAHRLFHWGPLYRNVSTRPTVFRAWRDRESTLTAPLLTARRSTRCTTSTRLRSDSRLSTRTRSRSCSSASAPSLA